jgi:signal transduction histidine kinase
MPDASSSGMPDVAEVLPVLEHDLRNPLNSALLNLTLAQRKIARSGAAIPDELCEATRELQRVASALDEFLTRARTR